LGIENSNQIANDDNRRAAIILEGWARETRGLDWRSCAALRPAPRVRDEIEGRVGVLCSWSQIACRRVAPPFSPARPRQTINQRSAVQRGVDLGKELRRGAPPTDEERRVLFNQTAQDVLNRG